MIPIQKQLVTGTERKLVLVIGIGYQFQKELVFIGNWQLVLVTNTNNSESLSSIIRLFAHTHTYPKQNLQPVPIVELVSQSTPKDALQPLPVHPVGENVFTVMQGPALGAK